MLALSDLAGLVVLNEIQRRPALFPALQVLTDRKPRRAKFLVLGGASPDLLRQCSESLAGRIGYYALPGLLLREVGARMGSRLWLRGRFPRSFLRTFLERDLPMLGVNVSADSMRHVHGSGRVQARDCGAPASPSDFAAGMICLLSVPIAVIGEAWEAKIRKATRTASRGIQRSSARVAARPTMGCSVATQRVFTYRNNFDQSQRAGLIRSSSASQNEQRRYM